MSPEPVCPCEELIHPRPLLNPPGRDTLLYRVGDFATFREALLKGRSEERELTGWRPSARGDLALQLLEWWAYLADILTFYNERIAHDAWLRTATTPGSVERLVRVLGYRPRPGLGATGVLAALVNAPLPITLPKGLAFQSKPGPGDAPQTFELDEDTRIEPSGALNAEVVQPTDLIDRKSVLIRGTVTTVRPGERLLVVARKWAEQEDKNRGYAVVTVKDVTREKDPRGRPMTRVTFDFDENTKGFAKSLAPTEEPEKPIHAWATDYRLLRASQTALIFTYERPPPEPKTIHLESIFRSIRPGELILLLPGDKLAGVTSYEEHVGRKPNTGYDTPHTALKSNPEPDVTVAIDHTPSVVKHDQLKFGWQEVGELIDEPPRSVQGPTLTLSLDEPLPIHDGSRRVLLEDGTGRGASGRATPIGDEAARQVQVSELEAGTTLTPPLRLLYNLLPVSRGVTVAREVLGNGDASRAGQTFVLQKSPLTYLAVGTDYRSTLRIWVNAIEWREVRSFHGQPPDARVFVTREDEERKTHVLFGDGIRGARLPTGVNNVVASYRHGSGARSPEAGALSVLLQPRPGLQSVRNPVPVSGGEDPSSAAKLRQLAPRSVLTFGRAISAGDYEALALDAPSVDRVRSYWAWDDVRQRPLLRLYVGDTPAARDSAMKALRAAADPQRRIEVLLAHPKRLWFELTVVVDPRYLREEVEKGLRRTLLDPETGLFGVKRARIGATLYDSQIHEACLSVPGALAVHGLRFWSLNDGTTDQYTHETWPNHWPGEGGFYVLDEQSLELGLKESTPHA